MVVSQSSSRPNAISLTSPEDFTEFYEQVHLDLFRYVMVLCAGNQDETEEITAEAFFRAWEKRRQFSGTQPAAFGWLITVARNILIDRRRSEGKHPVETFVDEELTDQGIDLEAILVDREQFQSTLAILQELPFPQGDIIALRYVLGWQIKAIAEHLGMAENTVSVYLRRAISKLQARLSSQDINA